MGKNQYDSQVVCKDQKKDATLILAIIPECNPMVFMKNGSIHIQDENMDPICNSLCVFIKNTPEGRKLAKRLRKSYPASKSVLHSKA